MKTTRLLKLESPSDPALGRARAMSPCFLKYIGTGDRHKRQTYDEWGCLWVRSEMNNMGQIKSHPLQDWALLNSYHWPDPDDPAFYDGMEAQFRGLEDRYILTDFFMLLFERMQALRGFENCLMDFYYEPEKTETLAGRLVDFDLHVIENISRRFPGRIHGLVYRRLGHPAGIDEFSACGARSSPLPILFDAITLRAVSGCDRRMNAILEDLVELGLDVVNFQQPRVNGIEEIGRQFRGRLCFESSADIQATLPAKSPDEIKEEARLLLEQWASPQGGFILFTSKSI
jgi:hypothetical protein